jgi:hypothetical protein
MERERVYTGSFTFILFIISLFYYFNLILIILAGSALWAKGLLDRINNQMKSLESAKGFIVPVDLVADVNQKFSLQVTTLEEYINKVSHAYSPSRPHFTYFISDL